MRPNYTKFMGLIPDETKEYVKYVFEYLHYFIIENKKINNPDSEYFFEDYCSNFGGKSIEKSRMVLSALLGLKHSVVTAPVVAGHGFSHNIIEVDNNYFRGLTDIEKGEVFNRCYNIFCFLDDETKYSTLLPSDIASHILNETSNNIKTKFFQYLDVDDKITDAIGQLALNQHTKIDNEFDRDLYMHLPYNTINYINVASSIRSILISKISNGEIEENEYIRNDDAYLVPLSLMLAIYGCDENSIEQYLTERGLTLKEISDKIDLIDAEGEMYGFDLSDYISNTKRNMEAVKILYKKYWTEGVNKDKEEKDIKVIDIVNNLFDRNFTQSIVIDRILAIAKKTTDDLKDMNERVVVIEKMAESSKLDNEINDFYSKINKDTKEFIIFTCKVYQTLLKKIKEDKYNQEILRNDNDFVVLAMYIASHFYNTDLAKFFDYHNVTFDKVMELVNIQITKEEIERETLDKAILLEKFKKFVLKLINSGVNSEYISINKVSLTISDVSFSQTMLIENIFEEIRRDINLPSNFYDTIIEFLKKKKIELEKAEKAAFFKDLPIEDLEYLTNVCTSYSFLSDNYSSIYSDELLVVLSLLLGLIRLENNKIKDLFASLGIDTAYILDNFSIKGYTSGDLDIELLKTKFHKYIFEGRNKDNKSPTIQDIAFNIFNEELYVSVELREFLNKLGLSYDTFKNPKMLIDEYDNKLRREKEAEEQENKNKQANSIYNQLSGEIRLWLEYAIDNYNTLLGIFEKDTKKYEGSLSKEKIEIISIVLAFFKSDTKYKEILEKHNLSKESILKSFGLPVDYDKFSVIEDHKNTLANVFIKYCNTTDDVHNFIASLCQNDFFLEIFKNNGANVKVLEVELKTGKDYIDTLTIDERIEYLSTLAVPSLENSSVMDIITCDKDLGLHSLYIQDEYPKLMQSTELETSTNKILELTKGVYTEKEVTVEPKGFFQTFFGAPTEVKREVKIDREAIGTLKPNINIQIKVLYDEATKLSTLKKYIEAYFYKNRDFINVLSSNLDRYKSKLDTVDKNDLFKVADISSYITILENKLQTLRLTDTLLSQEYFKLNQAIVNHCITINSLILSRDTLIPLIGTELAIGESIATEKNSIDITKNIVNLLNDIILQDIDGTKEVLEQLKSTNMSEEQLLLLSSSVNAQLNQIAMANKLNANSNTASVIAPRDTTYDSFTPNTPYKRILEP